MDYAELQLNPCASEQQELIGLLAREVIARTQAFEVARAAVVEIKGHRAVLAYAYMSAANALDAAGKRALELEQRVRALEQELLASRPPPPPPTPPPPRAATPPATPPRDTAVASAASQRDFDNLELLAAVIPKSWIPRDEPRSCRRPSKRRK